MRAKLASFGIFVLCGAGICSAQTAPTPTQVGFSTAYCSGFVTDQKVPDATRLVSGEQSNAKLTFARGDYVYINRGQEQGVRVGDRFSVVRADGDPVDVDWFKWQTKLLKAMGTHYLDAGELRVVNVQPKTATAQVTLSCDYMQRGDIVIPFQERPEPTLKDSGTFDHFAPVSGKPVAMIVQSKDYQQSAGQGSTVYVNLGTEKGVKVGDYFRVFRYQGSLAETAPQTKGYQDRIYGFGSSPTRYNWNDLPREVLGEGIVLNVSRNASTVLITYSTIDMYTGDYVELE
ncbi:MAG TPA: FlgT C-terminal domain-containing protein [Candidatus Solibacter sp.]|nr:FlgT C-terminal domain-containing protein [Candidatus Solibacter sp.]